MNENMALSKPLENTVVSLESQVVNNNGQLKVQTEDINSIIFSYFAHNCYGETAKAFLNQWKKPKVCSVSENNQPDHAGESCNDNNRDQKDERMDDGSNHRGVHVNGANELEGSFALTSLDCRKHLACLICDGHLEEALNYGAQFFPHIFCDDSDPANRWLRFRLMTQHFVELVRRGESIQALDYTEGILAPLAQNDPKHLAHLQEAVVLLAYADPAESPVRHLLSTSSRHTLALSANAAILKKSRSPLEDSLRQLVVVNASTESSLGEFKRDFPQSSVDLERLLRDLVAKDSSDAMSLAI